MLLVTFLASNPADTNVAVKWSLQPTTGGPAVVVRDKKTKMSKISIKQIQF